MVWFFLHPYPLQVCKLSQSAAPEEALLLQVRKALTARGILPNIGAINGNGVSVDQSTQ